MLTADSARLKDLRATAKKGIASAAAGEGDATAEVARAKGDAKAEVARAKGSRKAEIAAIGGIRGIGSKIAGKKK